PAADRPMRFETMADDIAALIRSLGLERAAIMGFSLGGAVGLRTALQHPEVVERLVLVSTVSQRTGWYPDKRPRLDDMGSSAPRRRHAAGPGPLRHQRRAGAFRSGHPIPRGGRVARGVAAVLMRLGHVQAVEGLLVHELVELERLAALMDFSDHRVALLSLATTGGPNAALLLELVVWDFDFPFRLEVEKLHWQPPRELN